MQSPSRLASAMYATPTPNPNAPFDMFFCLGEGYRARIASVGFHDLGPKHLPAGSCVPNHLGFAPSIGSYSWWSFYSPLDSGKLEHGCRIINADFCLFFAGGWRHVPTCWLLLYRGASDRRELALLRKLRSDPLCGGPYRKCQAGGWKRGGPQRLRISKVAWLRALHLEYTAVLWHTLRFWGFWAPIMLSFSPRSIYCLPY